MNKFLLTVAAVFLTGFTACSQKGEQNDMNKTHRTLVAYFSATGTTARAAHIIADVTGSELFVIDPQTPYSNADLNWHDKQSRSSVEMDNPKAVGGDRIVAAVAAIARYEGPIIIIDMGTATTMDVVDRAGSYIGDDQTSVLSIKHKIKKLTDEETAEHILSDDEISELLAREGIRVARRTVAKYREAMGIGSSAERKRAKRSR